MPRSRGRADAAVMATTALPDHAARPSRAAPPAHVSPLLRLRVAMNRTRLAQTLAAGADPSASPELTLCAPRADRAGAAAARGDPCGGSVAAEPPPAPSRGREPAPRGRRADRPAAHGRLRAPVRALVS